MGTMVTKLTKIWINFLIFWSFVPFVSVVVSVVFFVSVAPLVCFATLAGL